MYTDLAFNEPMDAVVFATAASLGFAAIEKVDYVLSKEWKKNELKKSVVHFARYSNFIDRMTSMMTKYNIQKDSIISMLQQNHTNMNEAISNLKSNINHINKNVSDINYRLNGLERRYKNLDESINYIEKDNQLLYSN